MRFRSAFFILLLAPTVTLVGCTSDWWTRGQPASVHTLLQRSEARLSDAISARGEKRQDIANAAKGLSENLLAALKIIESDGKRDDLLLKLNDCRGRLMDLEPNLSIGSRAPYGELAGQFRVLENKVNSGEKVEFAPLGLFTARTMFFLANELEVPAPTYG